MHREHRQQGARPPGHLVESGFSNTSVSTILQHRSHTNVFVILLHGITTEELQQRRGCLGCSVLHRRGVREGQRANDTNGPALVEWFGTRTDDPAKQLSSVIAASLLLLVARARAEQQHVSPVIHSRGRVHAPAVGNGLSETEHVLDSVKDAAQGERIALVRFGDRASQDLDELAALRSLLLVVRGRAASDTSVSAWFHSNTNGHAHPLPVSAFPKPNTFLTALKMPLRENASLWSASATARANTSTNSRRCAACC